MPTDLGFNGVGYSGVNVAVGESQVGLSAKEDWWNLNYRYKKILSVANLGTSEVSSGTPITLTLDTSSLGLGTTKLQTDLDDLRVVYSVGSSHSEISRSFYLGVGVTNLAMVTFPVQAVLGAGETSTSYALYYGNPAATNPVGSGFSVSGKTATLVCPFEGSTTCVEGETPSVESGAVRYSRAGAMSFDGANDNVVAATGISGAENWTVEFWYQPRGFRGDPMMVFGGGGNYHQWNNGRSDVQLYNVNGCTSYSVSTGNLTVGNWYHIAEVRNGSSIRVFVNGSGVGATGSCSTTTTLGNVIIGGSNSKLEGVIDEVRISNNARYSQNFSPQTTPFKSDANTTLLLHFDESGDDPRLSGKAFDASGNGRHGTISGAKYVSGIVGVDKSSNDKGNILGQSFASRQGLFLEEATTNLIPNPSFEGATYNTGWGASYLNLGTGVTTYTPNVSKRNSAGPFSAGVMVQGNMDGVNNIQDDRINAVGTNIGSGFNTVWDGNQGTITFWVTPEWNGNDGKVHGVFGFDGYQWYLHKAADGNLYFYKGYAGGGNIASANVSSWQAGTTYQVTVRWDIDNPIDATHYASLSVNDSHTYSWTTSLPASYLVGSGIDIGAFHNSSAYTASDAIIEGFTIYRRVLYDGQYGVDVGNGDEINQIYNLGTGKDPTLITGSWDVVFALPTNSATGSMGVGGTGQAWSHPHSSNLLGGTNGKNGFMMDGIYTNDGWQDALPSTYFAYNTVGTTFTPNVSKRNSAGPFAAGVMVQGILNSPGDLVSAPKGNQISNLFYQNHDLHQGTVSLWWTPEMTTASGTIIDNLYSDFAISYTSSTITFTLDGYGVSRNISWVPGTTYLITARWDLDNPIDGTNYLSVSIDDVHTFGVTNSGLDPTPRDWGIGVGSNSWKAGNGIIEGLTVYRRVLFDGTYGINVGNGDEIAAIYNSGTGKDPTEITGSWDVVFALPTNASTGSLGVGGTGQAWSHPHSSNKLYTSTTNTGGFMMGASYTADGWSDWGGGAPSSVTNLTASQKIYPGGYAVTNGTIMRTFSNTAGDDFVLRAVVHSDGSCTPKVMVYNNNSGSKITELSGIASSTRTNPGIITFTWEAQANNTSTGILLSSTGGTCYWDQVEVLANGGNNPSFEGGTGDPWLPTGWGNVAGLDTSEGVGETGIVHSGTSAFRMNGATSGEGISQAVYGAGTYGKFFTMGAWAYGVNDKSQVWHDGYNELKNAQGSSYSMNPGVNNQWVEVKSVGRHTHLSVNISATFRELGPVGGDIVTDDFYLFKLDDVALTVTPASLANSTETTGIRVDGADEYKDSLEGVTVNQGTVRFKFTPRHSFGIGSSFGVVNPVIVQAYGDASNYIKIHKSDSNTLQLYSMVGGTAVSVGWTSPTLNAGTTYALEIGYSGNGGQIYFKVNNTTVGTTAMPGVFGTNLGTIFYGTDNGGGGSNPYEGTYDTPTGPVTVAALATAEKVYPGGYKTTTDLINSGIGGTVVTTGGSDFVVRGVAHSDGTCIPKITLSDYTAGVGETDFGSLLGSVGAGRTNPSVILFTGEMPGSGTKTLRVKLTNAASSGTCFWHQVEVLPNLVTNPSFETGSGDPSGSPTIWSPTGWNTSGFVAGELQRGVTTVHSGNYSLHLDQDTFKWTTVTQALSAIAGKYYSRGFWGKYSSGAGNLDSGYTHGTFQYVNSDWDRQYLSNEAKYNLGVIRAKDSAVMINMQNDSAYNVDYDDIYSVLMNDVSLTVTPASQVNSSESTGIRVDGADLLTMPISGISATNGIIKFRVTPRHNLDLANKFGSAYANLTIFQTNFAGNGNYLWLTPETSSYLLLRGVFNGNTVDARWSNAILNAGTTYDLEMSYGEGDYLRLKVNGVEVAKSTGTVPTGGFSTMPTTAYFGVSNGGSYVYDATFSNFVALTPTENTASTYTKFGSKSVKLVNSGTIADEYTIALKGVNASTLSAYVYDGTAGNTGGVVDGSVVQLAIGSTGIGTSYSDMGGGWWRLNSSFAGVGSSQSYGIQVKPGKTIYVDGVQLEEKGYTTSYTDGSLGVGYSWSGTANNSSSSRAVTNIDYSLANNLDPNSGSISLWYKPDFSTTGVSKWNPILGMSTVSTWPGLWYSEQYGIFIFLDSTGSNGASKSVAVDRNKWYHLVVTWENGGGNRKIYVNNGTPGTNNTVIGSFNTLKLGRNGIENYFSKGETISDMRVYNSALTATEVAALYAAGWQTHQEGVEEIDRYQSSGSYVSPAIDLGANGEWGVMPWNQSQNLNGGTINYFTKTSADNSSWSEWVPVGVGGSVVSEPRRYLQWKADLTSNIAENETPVVSGMTVAYVEDTQAPINPEAAAVKAYSVGVGTTELTSGEWYNYSSPTFEWGPGVDTAVNGQSASGIVNYEVLLTKTAEATPSANVDDNCYKAIAADTRILAVGATGSGGVTNCSLTNGIYYLRMQTKDNSGNISEPQTLFTYKFDKSAPSAPASVSTTTIGYSAASGFTFFWPAVTDAGPAGIRGYQYKTGTASGILADWQETTETSVSEIPAYTEGQNQFFVRAVDRAGNFSTVTTNSGTASYYYNQSAPTAPLNVVISPLTNVASPSASNSFTVKWDKPESYNGEIAKYHYCVNCTPSEATMAETTAEETVTRELAALPLATQQGKNTFYIVAEDNTINETTGHGNRNFEAYTSVDFYAETVAPAAPTNLTINDASDRSSNKWRLTLAWDVGTTGPGGVDHYEVYRSDDNSSFSKIGEVNGSAYTDGSLSQSKSYYYKILAVDNAGASSTYSATVTKAPEGKYSEPPGAGGTPTVEAGSTTATIKWTTSRKSFGGVDYGKTSSYGSTGGEAVATTDHQIKIGGLAPGATYHYRIQSLDDSALVGYERSEAYSGDYSFTTLATAEIGEVEVTDIGLESAVVKWKAASLVGSKIDYGETSEYGQSIAITTASGESNHVAKIDKLKHSTKYHFRISGTTVDGTEIATQDQSFSTITFPKITAYVLKTDQTAGGTVISLAFSTNVETSSVVEYQTAEIDQEQVKNLKFKIKNLDNKEVEGRELTTALMEKMGQDELARIPLIIRGEAKEISKSNLTNTHILKIENLEDGAVYIFRLKGRDKYGNEAVSDPIRYVTGKDTRSPVVKNLAVETQLSGSGSSAMAQILISWETDEPATTQVAYGQGVGSEYPLSSIEEKELTTHHLVVLKDLEHTNTYHLKIISKDEAGNEAKSGDLVAVTPASSESALDVVLQNLEEVFGFLKI